METALREPRCRIFGLDLLRASAVSMVVCGHMLQHSRPVPWVKAFGHYGVLGVEIFFVLSGFLIGGIIIDLIERKSFETFGDLVHFWSRRWLRTLPLYYLFFVIYLYFDWTGPSRLVDHLDFLVFLQNFAWRGPDFFLLSWSLAIEEHFYLLFPLVFFGLRAFTPSAVTRLKGTLVLFLVIPLVIKFLRAPFPEWGGFDFNLRMIVVGRLDSLMYGVGAAGVKRYYPLVWSRLQQLAPLTLGLGVAVLIYFYLDIPGLFVANRWVARGFQTLLFPCLSLAIALILPVFDEIRSESTFWARRAVTYLSTISYSIYLGHILVLTFVNRFLNWLPSGMTEIYPHPLRLYPIYLVLILLLTPITYYGWELPFLRLRDRGLRIPASWGWFRGLTGRLSGSNS